MELTNLAINAWDTFWTPTIWLPGNVTWKDFERDDISYPKFSQICYPIFYSVVVIFVRFVIERYIWLPLGLSKGLKLTKNHLVPNVVLEKAFLSSRRGNLNHTQIQGLSKQVDMNERQIQRWMRKRHQNDRPPALVKLTESGWRFTYYLFAVTYGLWALWDKPYLWDFNECWINFPHQHVPVEIWFYYTFQLSCYWSMLFSQFIDVKRKDFLEMFIHHLATILLITFSWTCNLVRGGSLILIIHDCADVFMEAAKIFKYIRWQKACDICFGTFFVVWCASRLVTLPFYMMRNIWYEAGRYFPMFPAYEGLKVLLFTLFLLHIVWTYFILKILYRALLSGKTEKDSRSSSSEMSSEEEEESSTDPVSASKI